MLNHRLHLVVEEPMEVLIAEYRCIGLYELTAIFLSVFPYTHLLEVLVLLLVVCVSR